MNLGGNGRQPTSLEVLASIRRTIASNLPEEAEQAEVTETTSFEATASIEDDDFELPAMFRRPRDPSVELPSALIDDLGAIINSLNDARDGKRPRPVVVQPPPLPAHISLGDTRYAHETAAASDEHPPREMPSCRDTLMVRMGGRPALPMLEHLRRPSAVPKGSVGQFNYLIGPGGIASNVDDVASDDSDPVDLLVAPLTGLQTREPVTADTADMLRPVLQQWLDENINRVFAEALQQSLKRERDN